MYATIHNGSITKIMNSINILKIDVKIVTWWWSKYLFVSFFDSFLSQSQTAQSCCLDAFVCNGCFASDLIKHRTLRDVRIIVEMKKYKFVFYWIMYAIVWLIIYLWRPGVYSTSNANRGFNLHDLWKLKRRTDLQESVRHHW